MPRLSEETKNARRLQVIDAARACFERRGFSGTSMADIIQESGLSAGSIYSHFESKSEILQQTAESTFSAAERMLHASGAERGRVVSPRQVAELVKERLTHPPVARMFLQVWAEAPMNPELAELVRTNLDRALDLLGRAVLPWASTRAGAGEGPGMGTGGAPGRGTEAAGDGASAAEAARSDREAPTAGAEPNAEAARIARSTASAVMAVMHGYFVRVTVDETLDPEALFDDVTRFLPGGGPEATPGPVLGEQA